MWDFSKAFSNFAWASKGISAKDGALNPLLWLCGICVPAAVLSGIFGPSDWAAVMFFALLSPVALAMVCYTGLLLLSPDRLHSERHQIELRKLTMIGDDRSGGVVIDHQPTSNPSARL